MAALGWGTEVVELGGGAGVIKLRGGAGVVGEQEWWGQDWEQDSGVVGGDSRRRSKSGGVRMVSGSVLARLGVIPMSLGREMTT